MAAWLGMLERLFGAAGCGIGRLGCCWSVAVEGRWEGIVVVVVAVVGVRRVSGS